MVNAQLIKLIDTTLLTKTGKINSAILRREWFQNSELNSTILTATEFLAENATYSERVYCIRENINEIQYCEICKVTPKSYWNHVYSPTCSKQKCKTTYSFHNTASYDNFKESAKSKWATYWDDIKMLSETLTYSLEELRTLVFAVNSQKDIIRLLSKDNEQIVASILFHTKFIQIDVQDDLKLSERIFLINTGLSTLPLCEFCNMAPCTYKNMYDGYTSGCGTAACRSALASTNKRDNSTANVIKHLEKIGIVILEFDYLNSSTPPKLQCEHGHIFERYINNGRWKVERGSDLCTVCSPKSSMEESTVAKFITDNYTGLIETNYRYNPNISTKELDIFIPELNLGIEYNGIYWHSYNYVESKAEKYKHLNKTLECRELGIKLIQFNSLDWDAKQNIIKSKLLSALGEDVIIYSDNCTITDLTPEETNTFLEINNLYSYDIGDYNYGLICDGILISAMGFRKNVDIMECLYCVNKLGVTIDGWHTRLLRHFIHLHSPKIIIAYSDNAWDASDVYKNLGFVNNGIVDPNHIYYRGRTIIERRSVRNHISDNLTETVDENLSNCHNMFINKYRRYWDCGSTKWILNLK